VVLNVDLKSSVRLSWASNEGTDFQCLFYLLARKEKKRKNSVCMFIPAWMRVRWSYTDHSIPWCIVRFCASFDYLLANKSWNLSNFPLNDTKEQQQPCSPMNGENQPLVTYQPAKVQDIRKIINPLKRIYWIYLKINKENQKIATCNHCTWEL